MNTETTALKPIRVSELRDGYSVFGNKGNVWNNTAHIYKDGTGNLCGIPALSNNWARIEGVSECGCPECIAVYNQEIKPKDTGASGPRAER